MQLSGQQRCSDGCWCASSVYDQSRKRMQRCSSWGGAARATWPYICSYAVELAKERVGNFTVLATREGACSHHASGQTCLFAACALHTLSAAVYRARCGVVHVGVWRASAACSPKHAARCAAATPGACAAGCPRPGIIWAWLLRCPSNYRALRTARCLTSQGARALHAAGMRLALLVCGAC
jgi:hypothetical protein